MKFFTKEWRFGDDETDGAALQARYLAHLDTLKLPSHVDELARAIYLHDAFFLGCTLSDSELVLTLRFDIDPNSERHGNIELRYSNPTVRVVGADSLRSVVTSDQTDILDHEIDRSPVGFLHSLICWPYAELQIECTDVTWSSQPSLNGKLLHRAPRSTQTCGVDDVESTMARGDAARVASFTHAALTRLRVTAAERTLLHQAGDGHLFTLGGARTRHANFLGRTLVRVASAGRTLEAPKRLRHRPISAALHCRGND